MRMVRRFQGVEGGCLQPATDSVQVCFFGGGGGGEAAYSFSFEE